MRSKPPVLAFRRFEASDAQRVLALLGSEGQGMLTPSTLDGAASWIAHFPFDRFAALDQSGEIVGTVHISVNERDNSGELGYVTAREQERKRIATASIRHILSYGFEERKLHRIWARTSVRNVGSIGALRNAGLVHEATLRESRRIGSDYVDEMVFRLLSSEYGAV
jgi:RimJ/RimL family protein N-acetyltransferase